MGYLLPILSFMTVITFISAPKVRDPHKLTAVSNSIIASALYNEIRKENLEPVTIDDLDPDDKKRLCHYITGSAYFAKDLKRVPLHELFNQLRLDEREIFYNLYEKSSNPNYVLIAEEKDLVYKNPMKKITVASTFTKDQKPEKTIFEYAFLCLSRNSRNKTVQHHVSQEYNMSEDAMKMSDNYIAGRFIFMDYQEKTKIFGLAEEPATTLSEPGRIVEKEYLERRANNKPAIEECVDPLCSLSIHQRLRLCTLVMNADFFVKELVFTPDYKTSIDKSECFKQKILFRDSAAGGHFEEWVIRCMPDQYYASYQKEYFLSQAYASNEVFLYRWQTDRSGIIVENRFGNVRFAGPIDNDEPVATEIFFMDEETQSLKRQFEDEIVSSVATTNVENEQTKKKPRVNIIKSGSPI